MKQQTEFFKWSDTMSVKSNEIDDQHKKLVGLLNQMYQAFMDREHKEKVGLVIDQMAEYAKYHFETEEKYFAEFGYDDSENHIREHQQFRQKVEEFIQKYNKNHSALTYDVMNFLRTWLNHHILESDKKYVDCFLRNGVI